MQTIKKMNTPKKVNKKKSTDMETGHDELYDTEGQFDDEDYEGAVFMQDVLCELQ